MALLPLDIPPGFVRVGTDLQSGGRWREGSLVRWRNGAMQPVGGWFTRTASTANAAPRGVIAWRDNSSDRWVAIGTYSKLYALQLDGTLSDITPSGFTSGQEDTSGNLGYGGGLYGQELYGVARAQDATPADATTWALDTWGQYLVGCTQDDGKLYEWQLDTATAAAAITNAPTSCRSLVVTAERFLFALGAGGNHRKVQWCDQADNTTWTAAATNQAGDKELETSGEIEAGVQVRGQTLILTTADAHVANYLGPPLVYGFERVGTGCGVIGKRAVASVEGGAMWMGDGGFYGYFGGAVEEIPCDVWGEVLRNLNFGQKAKVYAVNNAEFSEIWWFYPQGTECDSYVAYNYADRHWLIGSIDRTAGTDKGAFDAPIWCASGGAIYNHEYGLDHGSDTPFAESGPISIDTGSEVFSATHLLPDELTQGDCTATFKTRMYPNGTEYEHGAYSMANPTSVRFTGRQIRVRVDQSNLADWRWGIPRLRVRGRGER